MIGYVFQTPRLLPWKTVIENINLVLSAEQIASGVVDELLTALLANGHALLVGVPGLAKTMLVQTIADALDLKFSRIQFTPDLMPTDITGTEVIEEDRTTGRRVFRFVKGPIFANIVLADEINRTPPKTQAALLEAMQERAVTAAGDTYPLEQPFFVLATQNPIEQEGTYPLPEAQLDRFMMRVTLGYPARNKELEMLDAHGVRSVFEDLTPVLNGEDVVRMTEYAETVHVSPELKGYLVDISEATRRDPDLLLGASPRATLFMQRAARVRAAAAGRGYTSPDDVKALLRPMLSHRVILRPEAQMRAASIGDVLDRIAASVPVPGTVTAQ